MKASTKKRHPVAAPEKQALIITRIFDAPVQQVWRAWTEPELMKLWWGPKSYSCPVAKIDLRVGGRSLACMRSADGKDIWSTGTYREIVPLKKIVTTDSFADASGNVIPASHYGMSGDFPLELLITVTFKEAGGRTKMVLNHEGMPSREHAADAEIGWNESFDKLAESLKAGLPKAAAKPGKKEITITRTFDAPLEQVWRAWTDSREVARWWGPIGFTSPWCKIDFREGGRYVFAMRASKEMGGNETYSSGVYKRIVPMELIEFSQHLSDEKGNRIDPASIGMSADFPDEIPTSLRFRPLGDRTELTVVEYGWREGQMRDLSEQGMSESLEKLAKILKAGKAKTVITAKPGKQEILISREFDAPRELVFRAYTGRDLIPQWWGPGYLTTAIEELNLRPGGAWRFVQRDAEGNEFGFHGVFHEVTVPERIIDTFEFEGLPEAGHVILETVRFEALPGNKTKLNVQSVFQSVEDRDGMLNSGMEEGLNESYQRLDKLLARIKGKG